MSRTATTTKVSAIPRPPQQPQTSALVHRQAMRAVGVTCTPSAPCSRPPVRRSRGLLRTVADVATLADLLPLEASLRSLVASNEVKMRGAIELGRLVEARLRTEKVSVFVAEAQARDTIISSEKLARALSLLAWYTLVAEECNMRHRIVRAYPPPVIWQQYAKITGLRVGEDEASERFISILPFEALLRDEILSRALLEENVVLEDGTLRVSARNAMTLEHRVLQHLEAERLQLETSETTVRTVLRSSLLQEHLMTLRQGLADIRRAHWADCTGHEQHHRTYLERAQAEEFSEILVQQMAEYHVLHQVAQQSALLQTEVRLRSEVLAAEDDEFDKLCLSMLHEWHRLYRELVVARGPYRSVAEYEMYSRRDIFDEYRLSWSDLCHTEDREHARLWRQAAERHFLHEEYNDGMIALCKLEVFGRRSIAAVLVQSLHAEVMRKRMLRLDTEEASERAAIVSEMFHANIFAHTVLHITWLELRRERAASSIASLEVAERAAIQMRLAAVESLLTSQAAAFALLFDTEERHRAGVEFAELKSSDELQQAAAELHHQAALQRASTNSQDFLRASAEEHSHRRFLELEGSKDFSMLARKELCCRESVHRSEVKEDECCVRGLLYTFVLEQAEAVARWDFQWDCAFELYDDAEDMVVAGEIADRNAWLRFEVDRRDLIYSMRNQPLPPNLWVGALEGDETQIRRNIEYEAEVSANATYKAQMLQPGEVQKIMVSYCTEYETRQVFIQEKSLAERIGDALLYLENTEETEERTACEQAEAIATLGIRVGLEEALDRTAVESFEASQRDIMQQVLTRTCQRIHDRSVLGKTANMVDEELYGRNSIWLAARAASLALLELCDDSLLVRAHRDYDELVSCANLCNVARTPTVKALPVLPRQTLSCCLARLSIQCSPHVREVLCLDKSHFSVEVVHNDETVFISPFFAPQPAGSAVSSSVVVNFGCYFAVEFGLRRDIVVLKVYRSCTERNPHEEPAEPTEWRKRSPSVEKKLPSLCLLRQPTTEGIKLLIEAAKPRVAALQLMERGAATPSLGTVIDAYCANRRPQGELLSSVPIVANALEEEGAATFCGGETENASVQCKATLQWFFE